MNARPIATPAVDPLGLPDISPARARFGLLDDDELEERARSTYWVSARVLVRELTRYNRDNRTKVPVRDLVVHPAAVAEVLAVREQVLASIDSRRRRMYRGYDLEAMLAWGLADVERRSEGSPYRRPGLRWRPVWDVSRSAYALVHTSSESGQRRVLAWRRHELMSCVDPERFAAALVFEASRRPLTRENARWRSPEVYSTLELAAASEPARRFAALCAGGRAGALADSLGALRVSSELARYGAALEGAAAAPEAIWAHPCVELSSLTLSNVVQGVRGCVSETVELRELLGGCA